MTDRQRVAFGKPCLTEEQCLADSCRWLRLLWSVILMPNVGLSRGVLGSIWSSCGILGYWRPKIPSELSHSYVKSGNIRVEKVCYA
jgi:hypothetical protein